MVAAISIYCHFLKGIKIMAIIIKPLSNLDIKNATSGKLRDGTGLFLKITR